MCRYDLFSTYRTHFACIPCRSVIKDHRRSEPPACRRCGAAMSDMGRDFHAPRRRDRDEWRKLALLAADGKARFDGCGCRTGRRVPRTLADAKQAAVAAERAAAKPVAKRFQRARTLAGR